MCNNKKVIVTGANRSIGKQIWPCILRQIREGGYRVKSLRWMEVMCFKALRTIPVSFVIKSGEYWPIHERVID